MFGIKYPRTFHLPSSRGRTSDDKVLKNIDHLLGQEVIITEKMDGENTTMYRDGFHARSIDSRHHPSRDWVAKFHGTIKHDIPEGWRICGENCYARHSIAYNTLKSYFLGFGIWDEDNQCLGWDDTLQFFELIGITPVTQLYRGIMFQNTIDNLVKKLDTNVIEGCVVRVVKPFGYDDFHKSVAKWVREFHVQTNEHWMHGAVVPNKVLT